jgi:enoyl-CoA hydratase
MTYGEYSALLVEQKNAVLKVTVNRPHVLNAQSRVMREELDDVFEIAEDDDDVRVVIIAGAGKHFSAGHDLGSAEEMADREERPIVPGYAAAYKRQWDLNVANTLRWRNFPKPTIAQVQGYCIMGGIILATACDLIVASDDARFSDRTVRWGGPHVQYSSLPWEIGFRRAKEYLFTGDWISADEAERIGLVNKVVSREDLETETMNLAERIALQDPFAVRLAKTSINMMQDEAGFHNGIMSAFHVYSAGTGHRREQNQDPDNPPGVDRARARDAKFGDNH